MKSNAEREFLADREPKLVRKPIKPGIPTGQAVEIDIEDLTPVERIALFGWADTVTEPVGL